MLKTLIAIANADSGRQNDGGPDYQQEQEQKMLLHILSSAPDAAAFDYAYDRLDPDSLKRAAGDSETVTSMVAKAQASAKPGDWAGYLNYIDTVAGTQSSGKNSIEFLVDGQVLAPLTQAIAQAKKSVHIEVYQYQADSVGWSFAQLMAKKVGDGVRVRLLVDDFGTDADDPEVVKLIDFLRQSGAEVLVRETPFLAAISITGKSW